MNSIFFLKEGLSIAYNALLINKLRTFLSLLGVTTGIFAIISVFTMVDTLENSVRDGVASFGEDMVYVQKWPWGGGGEYPWWKYYRRPEPSMRDFKDLQERLVGAAGISFQVESNRKVEYGAKDLSAVPLQLMTPDYNKVNPMEISVGRYLTLSEFRSGKPVCLMGSKLATELFGTADLAIDKTIKISGRKLQVVAVLQEEGSSMFGGSADEKVFIPMNYGKAFIDIDKEGTSIAVKPAPGVSKDELKDRLKGVMRNIRRLRPTEDDDFALNEPSVMNQQIDGLFGVINITGLVIGMFSVIVGGFSVSNIMFVSVRERINQIGIQKSLGAKRNFILVQFLAEAIFLCLFGGLIGLALIFLGTVAISAFTEFDIFLSLKNVVVGLGISAVVGVVSGIVPAYLAAKMDPVEAIRST